MIDREPTSGRKELGLELAERDPGAYKVLLLDRLAQSSAYGPAMWNKGIETGVVDPARFALNTRTWVSHSRANGEIDLGVKPMDVITKDKLLFHGERFSYSDEVGYRLNHELAHNLFFLSQNTESTQSLVAMVQSVRQASGGATGLTALGSLESYQGDAKITEDAVELLAMYMWQPSYLHEYVQFLGRDTAADIRAEVGVATIADAAPLYEFVEASVLGVVA